MNQREFFVVVADLDAENAIKTLLCDRQPALGIRVDFNPESPPQGDLLRYAGRDSGCLKDAVDLLRAPQRSHRHAMLIFDRDGSGAENEDRREIESDIESKLQSSGWASESVAVIVIEPELEAWVWADSPHVANALGWNSRQDELRRFLERKGLWGSDKNKPDDPKTAMKTALREKRKPFGAPLFSEIASRVGLTDCYDSAFRKFSDTLIGWFGI